MAGRNDECRLIQFGNLDFPFPSELADFGIPAPCIDGKERHLLKVVGKLTKQSCLLFPIQRIGLPLLIVGKQFDLWRC
jgi:hypothetical protein